MFLLPSQPGRWCCWAASCVVMGCAPPSTKHVPALLTHERSADCVDIRRFGALADGTHDDADAFEATVQSLPAVGGCVSLPAATIRLGRGVVIRKSGVMVVGAGRAATVLRYDGKAPITLMLFDAVAHIAIRDLALSTTQDSQSSIQVELRDSVYFDIRNVSSFVSTPSLNNQVTGIRIAATKSGQVPPRGFGHISNYLYTAGAGSAKPGSHGIDIVGTPTAPVDNIVIDGWGNLEDAGIGIRLHWAYHCTIGGSYFLQGNNVGISVESSHYTLVNRIRLATSKAHVHIDKLSYDTVFVQPSFFNPRTFGLEHGIRTRVFETDPFELTVPFSPRR